MVVSLQETLWKFKWMWIIFTVIGSIGLILSLVIELGLMSVSPLQWYHVYVISIGLAAISLGILNSSLTSEAREFLYKLRFFWFVLILGGWLGIILSGLGNASLIEPPNRTVFGVDWGPLLAVSAAILALATVLFLGGVSLKYRNYSSWMYIVASIGMVAGITLVSFGILAELKYLFELMRSPSTLFGVEWQSYLSFGVVLWLWFLGIIVASSGHVAKYVFKKSSPLWLLGVFIGFLSTSVALILSFKLLGDVSSYLGFDPVKQASEVVFMTGIIGTLLVTVGLALITAEMNVKKYERLFKVRYLFVMLVVLSLLVLAGALYLQVTAITIQSPVDSVLQVNMLIIAAAVMFVLGFIPLHAVIYYEGAILPFDSDSSPVIEDIAQFLVVHAHAARLPLSQQVTLFKLAKRMYESQLGTLQQVPSEDPSLQSLIASLSENIQKRVQSLDTSITIISDIVSQMSAPSGRGRAAPSGEDELASIFKERLGTSASATRAQQLSEAAPPPPGAVPPPPPGVPATSRAPATPPPPPGVPATSRAPATPPPPPGVPATSRAPATPPPPPSTLLEGPATPQQPPGMSLEIPKVHQSSSIAELRGQMMKELQRLKDVFKEE